MHGHEVGRLVGLPPIGAEGDHTHLQYHAEYQRTREGWYQPLMPFHAVMAQLNSEIEGE
jgi:hypothetical protein